MNLMTLVEFCLLWGLIGCALFSAFVVLVFRTGFVWLSRDRSGSLKRDMPCARSQIGMKVGSVSSVTYRPIGVVHSSFPSAEGMPIQPSGGAAIAGTVEVFEAQEL